MEPSIYGSRYLYCIKEQKMKKLQRSKTNRVFFGVCGGLAEYLGLDPVAIRLVFVLITLFGGIGVVAYFIGVIIIPENTEDTKTIDTANDISTSTPPPLPMKKKDKSGEVVGIVLITFGVFFLLRKISFLDDYFDWISYHFWSMLFPTILLVLGVSLIMRSRNSK